MQISRRGAAVIVAAVVAAAGCAATLAAQAGDTGAGSLGELTAEIRQLRVAIEQSTRTQTQAQALGIFLTAQQSRLVQATNRVDTARRELDGLSMQSANLASQMASIEEAGSHATDAHERAALEDRSKEIKAAMNRVAGQEQLARTRELEASQLWQQEEARWNDLIVRLQEIATR